MKSFSINIYVRRGQGQSVYSGLGKHGKGLSSFAGKQIWAVPLTSSPSKSQFPQLVTTTLLVGFAQGSSKHGKQAMPINIWVVTTICQCVEGPELGSKVTAIKGKSQASSPVLITKVCPSPLAYTIY